MKLIERLKDRAPEYPTKYYERIISPYAKVGGTTKERTFQSGKAFSNVYKIYMYALALGLRKDYKLPTEGIEKKKFIEIRDWRPVEVVDYLILSLLTKANIDFNQLEKLDESEVEKKLTELRKLMEEYAHGGFDILESRIKDEREKFENDDFAFIDLIDEIEIK